MADLHHIYGACACERNKYNIAIPGDATSLVQVFWDNTAYSRKPETPVFNDGHADPDLQCR